MVSKTCCRPATVTAWRKLPSSCQAAPIPTSSSEGTSSEKCGKNGCEALALRGPLQGGFQGVWDRSPHRAAQSYRESLFSGPLFVVQQSLSLNDPTFKLDRGGLFRSKSCSTPASMVAEAPSSASSPSTPASRATSDPHSTPLRASEEPTAQICH